MTAPKRRAAKPRLLGLLSPVEAKIPSQRQRYPYDLGDRIGGDLIIIGHLAMGRIGHLYQVWSAEEWCAYTCKILAPDHRGDRESVAALRREGGVLRRLAHPNIVRQFREGEHDGLPYLVMEYLEGPSIFDLIEGQPERRLGIVDAIRTAVHIGAGLYHLHQNGFLHLDLKPANLLLRGNVPVLVDFDAARRSSLETRTAKPIGTDPYMSPEQVRRQAPSEASDVYGLGAVLYELLTGRWPYEDAYESSAPDAVDEARYPQLGDVPPPPARTFNPEIPEALDAVVMRCLESAPADRFESIHPMLLALTEQLEGPAALWPEGVETERRRYPRVT
ncbi:MAG TPA: serine/threonine-protein kinase [Longimicrobiales bacterium]|nr:serine/threonine-protein kinase [Longimicrobiales bacterium]